MTADEARVRVGEIRAAIDRAMRALSVPGPDWEGAAGALFDAMLAVSYLHGACQMEDFERRRYDSVYRQGDDHGGGATQDGA